MQIQSSTSNSSLINSFSRARSHVKNALVRKSSEFIRHPVHYAKNRRCPFCPQECEILRELVVNKQPDDEDSYQKFAKRCALVNSSSQLLVFVLKSKDLYQADVQTNEEEWKRACANLLLLNNLNARAITHLTRPVLNKQTAPTEPAFSNFYRLASRQNLGRKLVMLHYSDFGCPA